MKLAADAGIKHDRATDQFTKLEWWFINYHTRRLCEPTIQRCTSQVASPFLLLSQLPFRCCEQQILCPQFAGAQQISLVVKKSGRPARSALICTVTQSQDSQRK